MGIFVRIQPSSCCSDLFTRAECISIFGEAKMDTKGHVVRLFHFEHCLNKFKNSKHVITYSTNFKPFRSS